MSLTWFLQACPPGGANYNFHILIKIPVKWTLSKGAQIWWFNSKARIAFLRLILEFGFWTDLIFKIIWFHQQNLTLTETVGYVIISSKKDQCWITHNKCNIKQQRREDLRDPLQNTLKIMAYRLFFKLNFSKFFPKHLCKLTMKSHKFLLKIIKVSHFSIILQILVKFFQRI